MMSLDRGGSSPADRAPSRILRARRSMVRELHKACVIGSAQACLQRWGYVEKSRLSSGAVAGSALRSRIAKDGLSQAPRLSAKPMIGYELWWEADHGEQSLARVHLEPSTWWLKSRLGNEVQPSGRAPCLLSDLDYTLPRRDFKLAAIHVGSLQPLPSAARNVALLCPRVLSAL
ncbi:uncharacterized protein K489DRAFT_368065 [Dissoconium aciculare CBS 342.82]|uniref:Uncharacterized protein n=1 Tax=Dissoconium aciculare CBS 342.82 TaxID=1314786 RepID=A0A6J3M9W4_9PEZI|nr:uncharacterized protein K489DRAFT_368065 [Dissoconium aciculare CBS 342.82]KAF1824830.1 hypothetical protein K489DRAFT_368065 [Dissoconium aciculare CBS 342.82]